jgi:hypothetical protein
MKTPGPTKAEPSAPNSANSTAEECRTPRLTPRQRRLLDALLQTHGWIAREDVDRIAGASNGPQIILELRCKVTGHDGIEMQKADATDRDGKACKPGRYRLTAQGRQRAVEAMPRNGEAAA